MKKKTKQKISAWAAGLLSLMLAVQPLQAFAEEEQEQVPVSYQLTIAKPDNGTISADFPDEEIISDEEDKRIYSVDSGEEVKITISAEEGYTVSFLKSKMNC